jgi:hypothetical protein
MMTTPICLFCRFLIETQRGKGGKCDAFPDGIPDEIYLGDFDHRNPYPNAENPTDNGIRFEPVEEGS